MTKARDIANLVDSNGDVVSGALDNVPASDNASALTTGTLPDGRFPATLPAISGQNLTGVSPASNSITTAMLQNDSINADKIADDAIVTAAITNGAIGTSQIADDAVGNTKLDLTANYTLTGDIRTPNGFDLLGIYDQTSSDVAYDSDTVIHDWGSHLGTYKQFLIHTHLINNSNGGMHVYMKYFLQNTNSQLWQGQLNGQNSSGGNNTPFQGDGGYIRTAYRLAEGHVMMTKQVISNPKGLTNAAGHYNIMYETSWVYRSTGSAHAQGMVRATGSASATSKMVLNVDPSDGTAYTGSGNARVYSLVWGVSKV